MIPELWPKHGPSARVTLHFDGSASQENNPLQQAGCGCIANITHDDGETHTLTTSHPVGHCTSNEAEYLAVIFALRSVLSYLQSKNIRYTYVSLEVLGDSQLVINQLVGRFQVSSPNLEPLNALAKSLGENFLVASFKHCARSQNKEADELAQTVRTTSGGYEIRAVYRPSISSLLPVRIEGKRCVATHDIGKDWYRNDPNNFIDASFLRTLPNGNALFLNMHSALPFSILLSDAKFMTVLGSVRLHLQIEWRNSPSQSVAVEFFVVHKLPVPVHISVLHPQVPPYPHGDLADFNPEEYLEFHWDELPSMYAEHEFWHPATHFLRQAYACGAL